MAEVSVGRVNSLARIIESVARDSQVALAVLPDAAKLVFRGRPPSVAPASEAFGVELSRTVNSFSELGKRRANCVGPDEWLLVATGEDPADLFSRMARNLTPYSCSLVDVSHRSDAFEIRGMKSEFVLNHGCPLDLSEHRFPVGMCTRTVLGKSPILLTRTGRGAFEIDVWRSFSTYAWMLLDGARQEFSSDEST